MDVKIPYKPRKWAMQLHQSKQRWKVCVLHRRAGKTVATLNHLQRDALHNNNARYAFIAPTYKQAKDIAWDVLKFYARCVPGVQFNEQELRADYPNGARVRLYGADNPDSLRGIALWGVVFDEYSQQPANIFGEIISKALADHYGYAIWIGTVKGKNHLYKTFQEASKEPTTWFALWQDIQKTIDTEQGETIANLQLALEDDKRLVEQGLMTEEEYQQEWFLSVNAPVKGAVYAKEWSDLVQQGRLKKLSYDPNLPTYSSWDFGIGDATAIGIYQLERNVDGTTPYLIDYYENNNQKFEHYIDWLKSKPYKLQMSYGDPSGKNRQFNTGRSIFEDMNSDQVTKKLGYPMRMFARRTQNIDKINATKNLLKKLVVNASLEQFINAITNYHFTWDQKRGEFTKEPYHDWSSHGCDQIGYFATNYIIPHAEDQSDPVEKKILQKQKQKQHSSDFSHDFYSNKVA